MKGVILSINSRVQLVDISHDLVRHDVLQAALVIKGAFGYFPQGSIHVIVVDPGVGGNRKVVCLKKEGHFFIAPDNGVFSLVIRDGVADEICAVTNQAYFLKPLSNTFHGRDIFAPVAAHLTKGVDMLCLGQKLGLHEIHRLEIPSPILSEGGELIGEIIWIDHFGNLVTNIAKEIYEKFTKERKSENVVIVLGTCKIHGISRSYDTVNVGSPVALFGSRNLLEISVNQANAHVRFKAGIGAAIRVRASRGYAKASE